MAPKRMSSPAHEDSSSKKKKVADDIDIAPSQPYVDSLLRQQPTTREGRMIRALQMKEWVQGKQAAKRDRDGVRSEEDAVAKFHHLLRNDPQVRGKPSKAAEIIMADYGFPVPKELITDIPEADRVKLLKHGVAPSTLKDHGAKKPVSVSQPASGGDAPAGGEDSPSTGTQ